MIEHERPDELVSLPRPGFYKEPVVIEAIGIFSENEGVCGATIMERTE